MTSFKYNNEVSRFMMEYLRLGEVRGQTNSHIYANNTAEHEAMIIVN